MERYSPTTFARDSESLRWQSRLLLLLVVPLVGAWVFLELWARFQLHSPSAVQALVVSGALTLLVWSLRAATPVAAVTGGLFTACLSLATPGLQSLLWPLVALFLLTFAATRFGRRRKPTIGTAEDLHGRSASQVTANLAAACLATIPLFSAHLSTAATLAACIGALAEATADTLSSELGQVFGGTPVLLTTLRRVPAGTDGGVTLAGTLTGIAGAGVVAMVAWAALPIQIPLALSACVGGVVGLFIDSLLGATLERRGCLNNDAVNFLSTIAAACTAAALAYWL